MGLILSGVTCDYAAGTSIASRALAGVDLVLEPGKLAVVLGATGSGKTTLLRASCGLLPLVSGSVELDGLAVVKPGDVRGHVGLVFQRPESQFFALTVEDDCAFGPRNLGRSAEDARTDARVALAAVGLDPEAFAQREPWSLSGGEARRAAIAGVLAMKPRYLLLDEPTAGLDAFGRRAVCDVLRSASAEAGVLVVTHDPELFLDDADEVLVLAAGRSAFHGDVAGYLAALPELVAAGAVEAPEVPRTLMLARGRGAAVGEPLTLDPALAADRLAAALSAGEVLR